MKQAHSHPCCIPHHAVAQQHHAARHPTAAAMSHHPPVPSLPVPAGVERNTHLKRVFKNYARLPMGQGRVYTDGVPQMNSSQFHRLCQDAGFMEPEGERPGNHTNRCSATFPRHTSCCKPLAMHEPPFELYRQRSYAAFCLWCCRAPVPGRLSTTALDVILTRYRSPGTRRLGFRNFIDTLAALAYEMGFQFDDILEVLGAAKASAPMTPAGSAVSRGRGLGHQPEKRGKRGQCMATWNEGTEGRTTFPCSTHVAVGGERVSVLALP